MASGLGTGYNRALVLFTYSSEKDCEVKGNLKIIPGKGSWVYDEQPQISLILKQNRKQLKKNVIDLDNSELAIPVKLVIVGDQWGRRLFPAGAVVPAELSIGMQKELQVCVPDSLFKTRQRRSLLKQGFALRLPGRYRETASATPQKAAETPPELEFAHSDSDKICGLISILRLNRHVNKMGRLNVSQI